MTAHTVTMTEKSTINCNVEKILFHRYRAFNHCEGLILFVKQKMRLDMID